MTKDSQKLLQNFYEANYPANTNDSFWDHRFSPRSVEYLYQLLFQQELPTSPRVLDIGCGTGEYGAELSTQTQAQVLGIDPISHNLKIAKQNLLPSSSLRFKKGTIEDIPSSDSYFDLIWSHDMFSHVKSPSKAFRECKRVLKPKGYFLLFSGFTTSEMKPDDFQKLRPISLSIRGMSRSHCEALIKKHEFKCLHRENLKSEYLEYDAENNPEFAQDILRFMRLRRNKPKSKDPLSLAHYQAHQALYFYNLYVILGKIDYWIYLLQNPE